MSQVLRAYQDQNLWNMMPDSGGASPSDALLDPSSNDTKLIAQVHVDSDVFKVEATGSFSYNALKVSMDDVSGTFSAIAVYKNGILWETHTTTTPLDVVKSTFGDPRYLDALSGDDTFSGSTTFAVQDAVRGEGGNDMFTGYGDKGSNGADQFFGGSGVDTSIYRGKLSEYKIQLNTNIWDSTKDDGSRLTGFSITDKVSTRDGVDYLVDVERVRFKDFTVGLDIGEKQVSGIAYRLYKAAFDRTPDADGLASWIDALYSGMSLNTVASRFLQSDEFKSKYGGENPTNEELVSLMYKNVLHRNQDNTGYTAWVNALNSNDLSRETVLTRFSNSDENIKQTAELIANGVVYHEFWLG